jgi:hypothetical protein
MAVTSVEAQQQHLWKNTSVRKVMGHEMIKHSLRQSTEKLQLR